MRARFLRRYLSRGRRAPQHRVVLYGKPGCHLCDDAREMLASLRRGSNFVLDEVDITSDESIFNQYEFLIPVVQIDGEKEFSAPIRLADLQRALS